VGLSTEKLKKETGRLSSMGKSQHQCMRAGLSRKERQQEKRGFRSSRKKRAGEGLCELRILSTRVPGVGRGPPPTNRKKKKKAPKQTTIKGTRAYEEGLFRIGHLRIIH